jgi:hypothetical protein
MKHIVTISLVFFSLTQLAKTERAEGLRLLTERYCSEHKASSTVTSSTTKDHKEQHNPFFLTSSELTLIGILPELSAITYSNEDQLIADLPIRKKPKNNSP